APVGYERDPGKAAGPCQRTREWQVGVGNDHPRRAGGGESLDARLDGAVESASGLPHDEGAALAGPVGDGRVVAHDGDRKGPRRADLADTIASTHVNRDYLPDYQLPKGLHATSSLEEALDGAEVVVMGVPSHGFREILDEAKPFLADGAPIVSLTKGVEQQTLKRMTEVIGDVVPDHPRGVLTGPNLAKEVMAGWPAATVVAFEDESIGR